jgi:hypothetical protein
MKRVWLRDLPIAMIIQKAFQLDAVKGESEAVQVVIVPVKCNLKAVRISVGNLKGPQGVIASENVHINPVGFVNIRKIGIANRYPIESTYTGWWPDILLENHDFSVLLGDSQPVWIQVLIPRKARPGLYTGVITVHPGNEEAVKLCLQVKVWNYELPDKWHFHNIMSFSNDWASNLYGRKWTPTMRRKFLDFLLDRRINLASVYGGRQEFTIDEIMSAIKKGQNTIVVYALADSGYLRRAPWFKPELMKSACDILDLWMPQLKAAGVLKHTVMYGFDEKREEWFESMKNVFKDLKSQYKDLPTMTTAYDRTYGLQTGLTNIVDNFVPAMYAYNEQQASQARAFGTKVWWYETVWNIEQPLTRSRLIPWMTFRAKADGFLIWCINRWCGGDKPGLPMAQWKSNKTPIETKILNEWDPWLDGVMPNSSAMYIYPGVNGPLSSLRLENFRDGIEDYELLCAAVETLEKLRRLKGGEAKIAALREAIALDDGFILDAHRVDHSSERLLENRMRLLKALTMEVNEVPLKRGLD